MAAKKSAPKARKSTAKTFDSDSVDAYVKNLKHPLVDLFSKATTLTAADLRCSQAARN
jgi:hypothetical protein